MATTPPVRNSSGAAARIADTLLGVVGGRVVQLRVATQPSPGDGGQLGQPSPAYQDVPLAPVVFRKLRPTLQPGEPDRYELLISANAIASALTTFPAATPAALFSIAIGVVVDSQLKLVQSIATSEAFGEVYLYRLTLRDQ